MTWLFIPSSCVPASECSEKASGLHSSIAESDTEPFVTWSGKPVPPRSLSRLWKRERSIRRLSGLTYSRSTAQHGAEAWIASLQDSHARTSLSRGGVPVSTGSGLVFSSTSSTSLPLAVRGSSFWRTSQESYLQPPPLWTRKMANSSSARPPESWENWPIAGGMRNGRIYAHPTWGEIISANGGFVSRGAWPTPAAQDDNKSPEAYKRMRMEKLGRTGEAAETISSLQVRVQTWATPNVPNGGRSVSAEVVATRGKTENGKRQVGLESETKHWATPRASMATNGSDSGSAQRQEQGANPGLKDQASQWATPTARDHKDGATTLENVEVNGLLGRQVLTSSLRPVLSINDGRELSPTARTLRPRLNPAFACWLMGWPIWWTNPGITSSVRSEMALWRSKLQQRLSSFFNAQDCA